VFIKADNREVDFQLANFHWTIEKTIQRRSGARAGPR
jgi:hypothetical protein